MIDLKLGSDHDLEILDGDLQLVSDGEEVVQSAKIRLLFIKGEWFLDYLKGVPWFEQMFRTAYSLNQKTQVLRDTVLNTVGIRKINRFEFGMDLIERGSLIQMDVETIYGQESGEIKI